MNDKEIIKASEIIKALREAAKDEDIICDYDFEYCNECHESELCMFNKLAGHAAGLIESLQAEIKRLTEYLVANEQATISRLVQECNEIKAQFSEANEFKAEAIGSREIISMLQNALIESQRRERAAVEDLNGAKACFSCKHFHRNGGKCYGSGNSRTDRIVIFPCGELAHRTEIPDDGRYTYIWRGPDREGEKE